MKPSRPKLPRLKPPFKASKLMLRKLTKAQQQKPVTPGLNPKPNRICKSQDKLSQEHVLVPREQPLHSLVGGCGLAALNGETPGTPRWHEDTESLIPPSCSVTSENSRNWMRSEERRVGK